MKNDGNFTGESVVNGAEGTIQASAVHASDREEGRPTQWGYSSVIPLLAMSLSSFAIGVTEFVTTGLLTEIAKSYDISVPTASYVTSGYALSVGASPIITAALVHVPRKYALSALMLLFITGSLFSAWAPSFALLMLGRVLSGFAHGPFFGIGSVVVSKFAPIGKEAQSVALMFTGLTLAHVLGLPFGVLMGQKTGWRSPFWVIAGLGGIGLLSLLAALPKKIPVEKTNLMQELSMFKRPQVWQALLMTGIGFGGLLAAFGFITPIMTEVAGFSNESMTWLIAIYGTGLAVGLNVGGILADRALMPFLFTSLTLLAATLATFTFAAHYKIAAAINLFFLGATGFSTIPPLQKYVMKQAENAPTVASASNIAAFNLGTALAVYAASQVIDAGFPYNSAGLVGAGITFLGIFISMIGNVKWPSLSGNRSTLFAHTSSSAALETDPLLLHIAEEAPGFVP